MASPTQWTWVWVNSGSWSLTVKSGVLQSMGSQRVRHDWVTALNWTDVKNWLFGKDPDAGKDWRQKEKGMPADEMVGWHHWLYTWVWVSPGSWWWTWKPGVLRSMRLQRLGHDWVTKMILLYSQKVSAFWKKKLMCGIHICFYFSKIISLINIMSVRPKLSVNIICQGLGYTDAWNF